MTSKSGWDFVSILLPSILFFQGITILLLPTVIHWLFGVILVTSSILISYRFNETILFWKNTNYVTVGNSRLSILFIYLFGNRINIFLPILGFLLFLTDLVINSYSENKQFGDLDFLVMACSIILIAYPSCPDKYLKELDVCFLFLFFTAAIICIPIGLFLLRPDMAESSMDIQQAITSNLLALPLSKLLNIIGFEAISIDYQILFRNTDGKVQRVSILFICSGIYSLIIFISAFISYLLTIHPNLNLTSVGMLLLGILTAYFANLFRMVVIIAAGYYWGLEALYYTHKNIGWLIFIIWMALFWYILFLIEDYQEKID